MKTMINNRTWTIRPSNDDDFEGISQLRKLFLEKGTSSERRSTEPAYYRWKVLANPLGKALLYIVEDKKKIVGMLSISPKPLFIHGVHVSSGELGDGFVNAEYQGQGMFASLLNITREVAIDRGIQFIYGTPNNLALPSEIKAGYRVISSARVYNLVFPLNIEAVLAARFRSGRIFRKLVDIAFRLYCLKARTLNKTYKDITIKMESVFPEEVYSLCKKVSDHYDCVMDRNRDYLEWRYMKNPDVYTIWIARKHQVVVGYMITKTGESQNLKVGYLADFIIDPDESDAFSALLHSALCSFRDKKLDMVATWVVQGSFYYRILKRACFQNYKEVPIICFKNALENKVINQSDKWHFTMADSDNI